MKKSCLVIVIILGVLFVANVCYVRSNLVPPSPLRPYERLWQSIQVYEETTGQYPETLFLPELQTNLYPSLEIVVGLVDGTDDLYRVYYYGKDAPEGMDIARYHPGDRYGLFTLEESDLDEQK